MVGYRHRYMYYMTGLPGWMRCGYSPVGYPPAGPMPYPYPAINPGEELRMLEHEKQLLKDELEEIDKRIEEVKKEIKDIKEVK